MPTLTTNYEFQLPVEGADDDVWGGFLNANWTALDTRLFSGTIGADTTGNAATATSAASATLAADATKLATARTLTIGDTGKTFDGSANVTWTLGEVGVTLASQVEAEAGTDNTKFMTPLRTAEAIAALVPASNELTEAEATNDASTVFGQVSGQRLSQAVAAFAPPAGMRYIGNVERVNTTDPIGFNDLGGYAALYFSGFDFGATNNEVQIRFSTDNGATYGSWQRIDVDSSIYMYGTKHLNMATGVLKVRGVDLLTTTGSALRAVQDRTLAVPALTNAFQVRLQTASPNFFFSFDVFLEGAA